ncbi:hypothetical protein ACI2L1_45235, partial [Streptomyces sp. NPDC019531]|uniref:hypothetical protein n=1 Tax=Streptomyces sp. NPDC019531 TaxID=3365062 RepID=UPI0038509BC5
MSSRPWQSVIGFGKGEKTLTPETEAEIRGIAAGIAKEAVLNYQNGYRMPEVSITGFGNSYLTGMDTGEKRARRVEEILKEELVRQLDSLSTGVEPGSLRLSIPLLKHIRIVSSTLGYRGTPPQHGTTPGDERRTAVIDVVSRPGFDGRFEGAISLRPAAEFRGVSDLPDTAGLAKAFQGVGNAKAFLVDVPESLRRATRVEIKRLAQSLRRAGLPGTGPVVLNLPGTESDAGQSGVPTAFLLAKELGRPVIAPRQGLTEGSDTTGGNWQVHHPDGSDTRPQSTSTADSDPTNFSLAPAQPP